MRKNFLSLSYVFSPNPLLLKWGEIQQSLLSFDDPDFLKTSLFCWVHRLIRKIGVDFVLDDRIGVYLFLLGNGR
ncbi:hypothetical protein LOK49_LG03G01998 [Camellia lanceoleosa]|uniref:Uncharacterized protein n=1 Tax=Camellia lanceoleosa TaxID=1840588 RepID=A0ACC0IFB1_9ERIC|nr:hypothetical protein LOK49_LG03G01998 [Camellia lanceoleosa]